MNNVLLCIIDAHRKNLHIFSKKKLYEKKTLLKNYIKIFQFYILKLYDSLLVFKSVIKYVYYNSQHQHNFWFISRNDAAINVN